ncbi:glutamate receptor ionotropic, kainate 2-like [Agrilus planipennis]|uniref:Glutamate receptor ionotropic, kainate 2-like n=1 Tax=Agrilus planipennis TaxID=224129 RepID=A0A7F5RB77_AGRPL|nr:glutamate receptor ionotropic, kainate 2-like [Agrilus planipennis]
MYIHCHLQVILVTFFITYSASFSHVTHKIGALFSQPNYYSDKSFYYAIKRENMYNPEISFEDIYSEGSNDMLYVREGVCKLLEEGVVAIFGPSTVEGTSIAQSICENYEVPHIQVNWKAISRRYSQFYLNLYPDTDLLAKALGTVVKYMHWTKYVIIIEDENALIRLKDVLEVPNVNDNPVTVRKIEPNSDVRYLFKQFMKSGITKIILDCETDNILNYLQQAKSVGLLRDILHGVFLTSLDAHTLDFSAFNTTANITTVRIIDTESAALKNAITDWNFDHESERSFELVTSDTVRTEAALVHDATLLLLKSVRELTVTGKITATSIKCDDSIVWEDGLRLVSYMKKRGLTDALTGPLTFNEYGQRTNFSVDVVEIIGNNKIKTAIWHSEDPKVLKFVQSPEDQEKNIFSHFQDKTLIVSSRIGKPYLLNRTDELGNVVLEGFCYDLMWAIANYLNFSIKFELTEDNKYGNYDPATKSWNGIIGDILEHKAHLGICDLTITTGRRQAVDFSLPFMNLGISILYKKNPQEESKIFAFMEPFSLEVWLYTATFYLCVTIILFLVLRLSPEEWENPHLCDENPEELENIWEMKNCMWLTMGFIMAQGCDLLPKGISTRMALSMWGFFSLIVTSSYTANLAAFLTKQQQGPNIEDVESLAKSKVKYGVVDGGSTQVFFRTSNFSLYKRMWTQMQQFKPSVFEKDNADGVKRVLNSKEGMYAFFMENTGIEYEVERNCSLRAVGDTLDNKGYGIAMPLGAPYRYLINRAILKLQEDGVLDKLKKKWWKEKYGGGACDDEPPEDDAGSQKLGLKNVGGVFLVLGLGMVMGIIISIAEFLWNIRTISVEEHITFQEAFKAEAKFAANIWIDKKSTKPNSSESTSSSTSAGCESDTHSMSKKILNGTASLIDLDKADSDSK